MTSASADFNLARRCHEALRQVTINHPGGFADLIALRTVQDLCRSAMSAINDSQCIEEMGRIEDLARDLFSEDGHYKWAREGMIGPAVLKLNILKALVAFRSRVAHLHAQKDQEFAAMANPREEQDRP